MENKDNWYERGLENRAIANELKNNSTYFIKIKSWYLEKKSDIDGILLFLLIVIVGTACACKIQDWPLITGLYCIVSSLSTGGLVSLKSDSADWQYALLGLMAAFGVPLFGLAMGSLASLALSTDELEDKLKEIQKQVTKEEVQMMTDFGIANNDGSIDKLEFLTLCMVSDCTIFWVFILILNYNYCR